MASDILAPSKTREKIALKPGFHLVDWMNLMRVADVSGRKGAPLRRISMKEVREHNSRYDCWTVYNKKVYNITNYMDYHPGGVQKLMLGAGKDCTDIFNRYHAWVNCDQILSKCLVGYLIEEEQTIREDEEEEMEKEEEQEQEQEQERKEAEKLRDFDYSVKEATAEGCTTSVAESEGESFDRDEELLRAQAKLSLERPIDE